MCGRDSGAREIKRQLLQVTTPNIETVFVH